MAELWDLTDETGAHVGRTHRRGDPVPAGTFHVVVVVAVIDADGRLLLSHRAPEKPDGDMWEVCGGSALAGEKVREAAVRELEEETGISVEPAALEELGGPTILPGDSGLYLGFTARPGTVRPATRPQAGETDGFRWAGRTDLDAEIAADGLTPADMALMGEWGIASLVTVQ